MLSAKQSRIKIHIKANKRTVIFAGQAYDSLANDLCTHRVDQFYSTEWVKLDFPSSQRSCHQIHLAPDCESFPGFGWLSPTDPEPLHLIAEMWINWRLSWQHHFYDHLFSSKSYQMPQANYYRSCTDMHTEHTRPFFISSWPHFDANAKHFRFWKLN